MTKRSQKEKEWLAARKLLVTATDLPSIMRLPGAYSTPMGVYLDKTAPVTDDDEVPDFVKWGTRLQEPILAGYAEETGHEVVPEEPYVIRVHINHPILGASLDARWRDLDRRPVEAKNIGYQNKEEWGEAGTDKVPQRFLVQVHAQMAVTNTNVAELAALVGGRKLLVYRIGRDDEITAAIYEAARRFWYDHVVADTPPPVDGSDDWTRFLASRKEQTEQIVPANATAEVYAARLTRIRRIMAKLEVEEAEARNHIVAAIGTNGGVKGSNWIATYHQAKPTLRTNWERLGQRLVTALPPDQRKLVIDEHTTSKEGSRRFLFRPNEQPKKGGKHE